MIHDGSRPFPGVVEALGELAAAGRRVVFLTNTSRTAESVVETLAEMGIGAELYEAVITSGDVTRAALLARDPALFALLPESPRCLHVGDPLFVPWLFQLGLSFAPEIADAHLIIATAGARDEAAVAALRERLAPAAARGVPLVCTNPDRVIPTPTGLTPGPGAVAAAYRALGARVFLYGKPCPPIYAAARRRLGELPDDRVVAIGDLLETDIAGARAAGLASLLVTATGAHVFAVGPSYVAPDLMLATFSW